MGSHVTVGVPRAAVDVRPEQPGQPARRPASIGCTSTPMPTRAASRRPPGLSHGVELAGQRLRQPQVVRRGDLEAGLVAGDGAHGYRRAPRPGPRRRSPRSAALSGGPVVAASSTARAKPCGVCTARSSVRSTARDDRPEASTRDGVGHRQHRDHRLLAGAQACHHGGDHRGVHAAAARRRAPAPARRPDPARPAPGHRRCRLGAAGDHPASSPSRLGRRADRLSRTPTTTTASMSTPAREGLDRPVQQRTPARRAPGLGHARPETLPGAGSHDHRGDDARTGSLSGRGA